MAHTFFKVSLEVNAKGAGAELLPPEICRIADYRFIMVKEGGEEGIIQLKAPAEEIKTIASAEGCKKLTKRQVESLMKKYPPPRIKHKYRISKRPVGEGKVNVEEAFETDEKGDRILDTFQTVRIGFYIIDVPILAGFGDN